MPLKYGQTVIQKAIYNNVELSKIYYKQGTNNPVLVFATPTVFGGGNGSSIFGVNCYALKGSNREYEATQSYSNVSLSTMQCNVEWHGQTNVQHYGYIRCVTLQNFDISLYQTATLTLDTWANNANWGISAMFGTQSTNNTAYGTTQIASVSNSFWGTTTARERTLTLNLASTKNTTNSPYFYVGIGTYRDSGTGNQWCHAIIKSIVLS